MVLGDGVIFNGMGSGPTAPPPPIFIRELRCRGLDCGLGFLFCFILYTLFNEDKTHLANIKLFYHVDLSNTCNIYVIKT